MVPGEPASWANWGILALRQRNFDAAGQRLDKAREFAPKNDRIYYLLGLLESNRGNSAKAITDLRQAIQLNPANLRAIYQLATEVERQGDQNSDSDFQKLMQRILAIQPNNLAALIELSRTSAKLGDAATLQGTVEKIASQSGEWPADVKQQLAALQTAARGSEPRSAATRSIFLRNVLMQVPEFRASLSEIRPQPGEEAIPFTHFLRLTQPDFKPAPADAAMSFVSQPVTNMPAGKWNWIGAISLGGSGAPAVAVANAHDVRLSTGASFPFPDGSTHLAPTP
jgi:hypothetical protein